MVDERWVEIGSDECRSLLRQAHLGRVALVDGDQPLILPVNFVVDDGDIVFRTSPGSKLDAAVRGARVAFEIDGIDERTETGWSVLVRGRAHVVTDPVPIAGLEQALVPWAPGERPYYVRITPTMTTGRRITGPIVPSEYLG